MGKSLNRSLSKYSSVTIFSSHFPHLTFSFPRAWILFHWKRTWKHCLQETRRARTSHILVAFTYRMHGVSLQLSSPMPIIISLWQTLLSVVVTLILRRSRTGTVWFYTSTSNKRAARQKLYTKSLTRDLKLMYSRLTLMRISIKL